MCKISVLKSEGSSCRARLRESQRNQTIHQGLYLPVTASFPSRHTAAESGGAARAGGQARACWQRRGHHPLPPHRRGILGLRGRVRVRRGRLDGVIASGGRAKAAALAAEDKHVQVSPVPRTLRSAPRHRSPSYSGQKRRKSVVVAHFSSAELFFFKEQKISPYLCLVVVCVRRGIFMSCLSVSPVSPREALTLSLSCTTTQLLVLLDLWRRNPVYYCYTRRRTFLKNNLFFVS